MRRTPSPGSCDPNVARAALIPVSLFFLFAVFFARCGDIHAQTIPLPATTKLQKPKLSDDDIIEIIVTDEDGYWINETTARACLIQEDVAKGCVTKWKACEKAKGECTKGSRLQPFAVGVLAGLATGLLVALLVPR